MATCARFLPAMGDNGGLRKYEFGLRRCVNGRARSSMSLAVQRFFFSSIAIASSAGSDVLGAEQSSDQAGCHCGLRKETFVREGSETPRCRSGIRSRGTQRGPIRAVGNIQWRSSGSSSARGSSRSSTNEPRN